MFVQLYKFAKRENSTAEPSPADPTRLDLSSVQLKEECSMIRPVLVLSRGIVTGFNPNMYNYAVIPVWQRYYFIRDWQWLNGVWEAQLEVDVLASFKDAIGDTTAYVTRSAYAYDGDIIDSIYPATTDVVIRNYALSYSWLNKNVSAGCFVVGIISQDSAYKIGAVTSYVLIMPQLGQLLAYLFSDNIFNASSIADVSKGMFKSMFNPFQYIVSCTWMPFANNEMGGATFANIKVGYWDTGINVLVLSSLSQKTYVVLSSGQSVLNHPQYLRGSYLNYAPYTRMTMYLPPFGSIEIDPVILNKGHYLYCPVMVDHITGQATIRISFCQDSSHLDEYNYVTERSGVLGVPIQLAQIMVDYTRTITSVGSAVGSLLTGNIIGAVSGALSAIQSQMPKVTTTGTNGAFSNNITVGALIVEHYQIAPEDNTEFGRPLYQPKQIRTLSGYIQCGEDDHAFPGTSEENARINAYLKNGFFYE